MQPHVLIIEDDPWQADLHQQQLARAGYSTALAPSPQQAMVAIVQRRPQVIVADVLLAGNTSWLLLNELQSDTELGAIPVVVCSNQAELIPAAQMAHYGVVAVLDKAHLGSGDVVAAVRKALL